MLGPPSASVTESPRPVLIVEDHDDTRTLKREAAALLAAFKKTSPNPRRKK